MRTLGVICALLLSAPTWADGISTPGVPRTIGKPADVYYPPTASSITDTDTPLLYAPANASTPSTTAINYSSIVGGNSTTTWNATPANRYAIVPNTNGGTIKYLQVTPTGAPTASSSIQVTLILVHNGSTTYTSLTCNISSASACTDTSDSVSVVQGDIIQWEACPSTSTTTPLGSGCPATNTQAQAASVNLYISADFQTTDGTMPIFSSQPSATGTTDVYQSLSGNGATVAQASGDVTVSAILPVGGTIDVACVTNNAAVTSTQTWTAALYHNGSAAGSGLAAVVTSSTHSGVWACASATAEAYAALDTASVRFTPANSPGSTYHYASFEWKPTSAGQYPAFEVGGILSNGSARYIPTMGGGGNGISTEVTVSNVVPAGFANGTTLTYGNMVVADSGISSGSRAFTLRHDQTTPVNPACTLNGGTLTIGGVTTDACQDTSHTYAAGLGVLMDTLSTPSSTPTAETWEKVSYSVHVP